MKVVEQIIRHLRRRGALSHAEFELLRRRGFWPCSEDPYYEDKESGEERRWHPLAERAEDAGPSDPEAEWDRRVSRCVLTEVKRKHARARRLRSRRRRARRG